MRACSALLQAKLRLTLFTRSSCGLCDTAKTAISRAKPKDLALTYEEVDIMKEGNGVWKSSYEFDVPVLHVRQEHQSEPVPASQKLMHRFTSEQVEDLAYAVAKS